MHRTQVSMAAHTLTDVVCAGVQFKLHRSGLNTTDLTAANYYDNLNSIRGSLGVNLALNCHPCAPSLSGISRAVPDLQRPGFAAPDVAALARGGPWVAGWSARVAKARVPSS